MSLTSQLANQIKYKYSGECPKSKQFLFCNSKTQFKMKYFSVAIVAAFLCAAVNSLALKHLYFIFVFVWLGEECEIIIIYSIILDRLYPVHHQHQIQHSKNWHLIQSLKLGRSLKTSLPLFDAWVMLSLKQLVTAKSEICGNKPKIALIISLNLIGRSAKKFQTVQKNKSMYKRDE